MIVTPDEMRAVEDAVFATGTTAETLMDRVGRLLAGHLIRRLWRGGGTVLIYVGKGNNAGDALVAAQSLAEIARACHVPIEIKLRLAVDDPAEMGDLARKKLAALSPDHFPRLTAEQARRIPARIGRLCMLDGLLGNRRAGGLARPDPVRHARDQRAAANSRRVCFRHRQPDRPGRRERRGRPRRRRRRRNADRGICEDRPRRRPGGEPRRQTARSCRCPISRERTGKLPRPRRAARW